MIATCRTCPWCAEIAERQGCDGECHRQSPSPTHVGSGVDFFAIWPLVIMDADWCGEHPDRQLHIESEPREVKTLTEADVLGIVRDASRKASRTASRVKP